MAGMDSERLVRKPHLIVSIIARFGNEFVRFAFCGGRMRNGSLFSEPGQIAVDRLRGSA